MTVDCCRVAGNQGFSELVERIRAAMWSVRPALWITRFVLRNSCVFRERIRFVMREGR